MPTSDPTGAATPRGGQRKPWQRLLAMLCVLVLVVGINAALTYVLEPYGSVSDAVWYQYHEATEAGERFDTLVIGSSVAQYSLQPEPLDETLGCNAFCLSSPGQSPWVSLKALELALKDQPVKRVILGTSYATLAEPAWPQPDMACVQAMMRCYSLPEKIAAYGELLLNPDYVGGINSLAFLAPYTLDHVDYSPSAIMANLRNRAECATPVEACTRITGNIQPLGKGFANLVGNYDLQTISEGTAVANVLAGRSVSEARWQPIAKICQICEERDIELIVVSMPHVLSEGVSLSDRYAREMAVVQDYVEAHGATFLDFSMAKPELYDPEMSDFIDLAHLNIEGTARFTPILAQTIARIEAGEDVRTDFYSYDEWDAYLTSLDEIGFVYFTAERNAEGFALTAVANPGSQVSVEYEYALEAEDGSWEVVRAWDDDPSCTLPLGAYERARVRLSARQAGATEAESIHYQYLTGLGS